MSKLNQDSEEAAGDRPDAVCSACENCGRLEGIIKSAIDKLPREMDFGSREYGIYAVLTEGIPKPKEPTFTNPAATPYRD